MLGLSSDLWWPAGQESSLLSLTEKSGSDLAWMEHMDVLGGTRSMNQLEMLRAGVPSGCVANKLLAREGYKVVVAFREKMYATGCGFEL